MERLTAYHWPGNIRELENILERAVILCGGGMLEVDADVLAGGSTASSPSIANSLEDVERAHILATLKETGWVLAGPRGAALRLGLNRNTLQFRMKKLGIVRQAAS